MMCCDPVETEDEIVGECDSAESRLMKMGFLTIYVTTLPRFVRSAVALLVMVHANK